MRPIYGIFFLVIISLFACNSIDRNTEASNGEATTEEAPKETENEVQAAQQAVMKFGIDASAGVPQGLLEGDKAPDFVATDTEGNDVSLASLLEKGPAILMFYRGQWCPVCNRHLNAFQDSVQLLLAKGASVIAIAPETTENAQKTLENTKVKFPIIPDTEGKIMDAYKVSFKVTEDYVSKIETHLNTNIAQNNGSSESKLPVPATYIIQPDGTISYAHFDLNYTNRASVKELLAHLEGS